ncbi:MAG: nitroreductase family protein [Acidobacteriaceae bacterium]
MNANPQCKAIDHSAGAETTAAAPDERWWTFQKVNRDRRAIRDFDGTPLPDEDVEALIGEALLAPSSGNSQPYVIYWLRDPAMKAAGAGACRNQRAARSASSLLVFVAASRFALETVSLFHAWVESTSELSEKSRDYHRREMKTGRRFLRIAPSFLWSPLRSLLTAAFPSLALVPVGPSGVRNWAARSAIFAAQTILLAASARGLDSCPMEGFDPRKLGRILGLERGDVIAIVVALGRRRPDALIEPRWRRSFEAAVQVR